MARAFHCGHAVALLIPALSDAAALLRLMVTMMDRGSVSMVTMVSCCGMVNCSNSVASMVMTVVVTDFSVPTDGGLFFVVEAGLEGVAVLLGGHKTSLLC